MPIAFINHNWFTTVNNTNKTWNSVAYNASSPVALVDSANTATGWTVTKPATSDGTAAGPASTVGSGDASWADEAGVLASAWLYGTSPAFVDYTIAGLDNAKTYNLVFFGTVDGNANRRADVTIGGVTKEVIASDAEGVPNTTQVTSFTGLSPSSGQIVWRGYQGANSSGPGSISAWYIEEAIPPPTLTVTPADLPLIPGGTISGTYANYATIPTTLTVSDGTNTITIASPTIVDDAAGGGTFSGTMPALPTTGTANLVLFGDVTVELS